MPKTNVRAIKLAADDKPELQPFMYNLAFGPESAALPGQVMLRISRNGLILVEENMSPEEFLPLADAFENVARGVRNVLNGRSAG